MMDDNKVYRATESAAKTPEAPRDWFNTTVAFDSVPEGVEPPSVEQAEAAEQIERVWEQTEERSAREGKAVRRKAGFFSHALGWVKTHRRAALLGSCAAAALVIGGVLLALFMGAGPLGGDIVDEPYTDTLVEVNKDEYADVLLDKTADAGSAYLNETLFIGDSNTARIELYGYLSLDNVIGIESMGIQSVTTAKCVYFKDMSDPVTIPEAVKLMKPRRIIINFGTNNIIDDDVDAFIKDYANVLDALKKAYPYADIIIGAIPPLGSNRTNLSLTMKIVDEYNLALLDLAKEKGLTFLNLSETLKDSSGYMKSNYIISDGIHISKEGFEAVFRYIRTHSHVVEDSRPRPLGDIPKRAPAPVIETDKKKFDVQTVLDTANSLLGQKGHSAMTAQDDKTKAISVTYSVPEETKPGTEKTVANNFVTFIEAQVSWKTFRYSISYTHDEEAEEYVFMVLVVNAIEPCETHEGEWKTTKEATCTTDGRKQRTCTVCGTIETETIKAYGHTLEGPITVVTAATCSAEGNGTQFCSVCEQNINVSLEKAEHVWGEWSVTTEATCASVGSRSHTCTACGITVSEEIPKNSNHTGLQADGSCTACGKSADVAPAPEPPANPLTDPAATTGNG